MPGRINKSNPTHPLITSHFKPASKKSEAFFIFYFMDAYLNDMDLRQDSLVQIVNCVIFFAPTDTH